MMAALDVLQDVYIKRLHAIGSPAEIVPLSDIEDRVQREIADAASVGITNDLADVLPATREIPRSTAEWPEIVLGRGLVGVARTGSTAMASPYRRDRALAFLSLHLVLLLPATAVVADLPDTAPLARVWFDEGRRYLTFITGPSRTADIEQVLTVGVHGPHRVTVLLVEGWNPDVA